MAHAGRAFGARGAVQQLRLYGPGLPSAHAGTVAALGAHVARAACYSMTAPSGGGGHHASGEYSRKTPASYIVLADECDQTARGSSVVLSAPGRPTRSAGATRRAGRRTPGPGRRARAATAGVSHPARISTRGFGSAAAYRSPG